MNSHRGAALVHEFMSRNSLLKPLLEWSVAGEEFGVLILNRQHCIHCGEKWDGHTPAGGKCLFDTTHYAEGAL